jgi:hypothetical protein
LPEAPIALEGHVHGTVAFSAWRAATTAPPYVRFSGILPQIAARRGEIETTGFRANAVIEVAKTERPRVRWLVGAMAEFAGADTGKPAYAGRALAGIALPFPFVPKVRVSALLGVGIRDFGSAAPRAIGPVIEERIIVPIGKLRLHGIVEYSTTDGYAVGTGASLPIASVRLYAGGELDLTTMTTLFVIGAAIGDAY